MADAKISALAELLTPATTDLLVIVDVSDTSMAASGTDKRIQVTNLLAGLETTVGSAAKVATHEADTTNVHGIADTADLILEGDSRLTDSRSPNGAAGGVLSGTYPNPGFAADMATQAELDAHASDTTSVHGIADTSALETTSGAQAKADAAAALAAILAPATSARNVIQPSAADAVALTLKGHATQTEDLFKVTSGAGAVYTEVSAAGRVAFGAALDSVDTGYTSARLQVYDSGLSAIDEPIVQILNPQARTGLALHNTDDKYDGFYPWLWMLAEYRTADHFGQDLVTFWYGMHTPITEPAFGAFGYGREGSTNGIYIGVRSESTTDPEFAFIADLVAASYPLKVYPATKEWVFDADLAADALLSAGEFTWGYDDDNVSPTLTIRAKTADGTIASATIPLTPA